MTLYPPSWMEEDSYPAAVDRQVLDSIFAQPGIVTFGDLAVTQRAAGANMSVDVGAGKVVIAGTDSAGQGKYVCWLDGPFNVSIDPSPPAGQSRIDLIVAKLYDTDVTGLGSNNWTPLAVKGTAVATGSQVAPAVPPSAVFLKQVAVGPQVASIVNANLTGLPPQAASIRPRPDYILWATPLNGVSPGVWNTVTGWQQVGISSGPALVSVSAGVATILVPGLYTVKCRLTFTGSTNGNVGLRIRAGTGGPIADTTGLFTAATNQGLSCAWSGPLLAGDTCYIEAQQNSGAAQTPSAGASTHWEIIREGVS